MAFLTGSPSFSVNRRSEFVEAVPGVHVDNSINAGTKWSEKLSESTVNKFELKRRTNDKFQFFVTETRVTSPNHFRMHSAPIYVICA